MIGHDAIVPHVTLDAESAITSVDWCDDVEGEYKTDERGEWKKKKK